MSATSTASAAERGAPSISGHRVEDEADMLVRLHAWQDVLDAPLRADDEARPLVPMYWRPPNDFSTHTPKASATRWPTSESSRYGNAYLSRNRTWLFTLSGETP